MLVTSDYSFPFQLLNPKLHFQIEDIQQFIYANELSPKDIYQLLTEKWKVKYNLAKVLVELYGGQIWHIYQSLQRIESNVIRFSLYDVAISENINECLDLEDNPMPMVKILRELSEKGFVIISKHNSHLVASLTHYHIAALVNARCHLIGYPHYFSSDKEIAIIPTSQMMRMIIAKALINRSDIRISLYLTQIM